jgi:hypothetical protein
MRGAARFVVGSSADFAWEMCLSCRPLSLRDFNESECYTYAILGAVASIAERIRGV